MCFIFKFSAIKEFFYHFATIIVAEFGNCKKVSAMFPNLETLETFPNSEFPEFENAFLILTKFPNSGTLLILFCSFQIQQR